MTDSSGPDGLLEDNANSPDPVAAPEEEVTPPTAAAESEDEENAESGRFKEGQMLTFVRVRFPGQAKALPFFIGHRHFAYGQAVVAMSERGMAVGHINSFPYQRPFTKSMLPIHSISKLADKKDLAQMGRSTPEEKHAEEVCNRLIEKHQLNMVLTHVEFVQYGKKTVFYFNAPGRVDFRNLVKDLVAELKTRIELRQITVRDRAAAIGAVGPCGLGTCCSTFLESYGNVSIKMAKNQDLTLLPGKLNGPCGQIKCCIRYENDVYTAKRQLLPKVGDLIQTANGDKGKVKGINILAEQFDLLTTEGKLRRYTAGQYNPSGEKLSEDIFTGTITHLINETDQVIGLIPAKPKNEEGLFGEPLPPEEELAAAAEEAAIEVAASLDTDAATAIDPERAALVAQEEEEAEDALDDDAAAVLDEEDAADDADAGSNDHDDLREDSREEDALAGSPAPGNSEQQASNEQASPRQASARPFKKHPRHGRRRHGRGRNQGRRS